MATFLIQTVVCTTNVILYFAATEPSWGTGGASATQDVARYSSLPNRSAGRFINFEEKFPPVQSYFGLHFY